MVLIKSPELTHLITKDFYPLTTSPHFLHIQVSSNHHFICYYGFHFFLILYISESYNTCLSVYGLFHLAMCNSCSPILSQMAGFCSYGWITLYHMFFIFSSVNGHLGCCCILPIMNNSSVTMRVKTIPLTWWFHFFGYILRSEIVGSHVLFLII